MARFLRPRRNAADAAALPDINMTPLIDVMLVLLVMFIITIPLQSHAVKLDLPGPIPPILQPNPVVNRVQITQSGEILWNGSQVSREALRSALTATTQMASEPELQLIPDAQARYVIVDEVLALTRQAGVSRLGFVGNERYRHF